MNHSAQKGNNNSGYVILTYVVVVIALLFLLLIPLQLLILSGVKSAKSSAQIRKIFYSTEAAVYDSIARIVGTEYGWPPGGWFNGEIEVNGVVTQIEVTSTGTGFEVIGSTDYDDVTRKLQANLNTASDNVAVDVMIVLDTSGSMNDAGDSPQQPMTGAINAAVKLVNKFEDLAGPGSTKYKLGLVHFDDDGSIDQELTLMDEPTDYDVLNAKIKDLEAEDGNRTNIGDAVRVAKNELLGANGRLNTAKVIVLLSDGVSIRNTSNGTTGCAQLPKNHNVCTCSANNDDCPDDAVEGSTVGEAKLAHQAGIVIYSIGLNFVNLSTEEANNCDVPPCTTQTVARHSLANAASDNSKYYEVSHNEPTSEQLNNVFEEIAATIDKASNLVIEEVY